MNKQNDTSAADNAPENASDNQTDENTETGQAGTAVALGGPESIQAAARAKAAGANDLDARGAILACRKVFGVVACFSFFINLLMLTVPMYMMQVFDRVLTSRSTDTLYIITAIAIFCLVIMGTLDWVRSKLLVHISSWMDERLGRHVLATSIRAASLHRDASTVQGLRDLSTVRNFAAGSTIFHFFDAPWVPLFLLVIFLVHPAMGMIALVGALVLFGLALANDYATRKPLNEANGRAIKQMNLAEATVRNAEVVEAMGMLDNLVARWNIENRDIMEIQEVASRRAGSISAFTKFFRLLVQLAIMGVGVYFALGQQLTPGAMIAGSIILGRALAPIEQMIGSWRSFVSARASYDRLNRLLHRDLAEVRGEMTFPAPAGRLTAEAVTFGMRGQTKPILRGVSFALEAGESLGLIGPSAAGKSTLARLLVGVWMPTSGKIRLDNIDVFHWNRRDFGQYLGYLPQDIELFAGTIRENIARMGECRDEEVIAAAQKANAHDMILRLPEGYDTKIGADGLGLSGGQRQRIGLARALFGNPKLLILDEPNSNLDSEGEAALMDALKTAKAEGTTIVIIAHRPSVLAFVDKMLVLRDGMVEMFGDRNEVMGKLPRAVPATAGAAGQIQASDGNQALSGGAK